MPSKTDIKSYQVNKARASPLYAVLLGLRELGESMTAMARRLGISTPAVSKAVARGAVIAEQNGYKIIPS